MFTGRLYYPISLRGLSALHNTSPRAALAGRIGVEGLPKGELRQPLSLKAPSAIGATVVVERELLRLA
jgi:hypothetical protein